MKRIVKLIQECGKRRVSKIWLKRNEVIKKNLQIDGKRHQSIRIKNSKQYTLKKKVQEKNDKQVSRKRSQRLWENFNESVKWNGIYIEKRQLKMNREEIDWMKWDLHREKTNDHYHTRRKWGKHELKRNDYDVQTIGYFQKWNRMFVGLCFEEELF